MKWLTPHFAGEEIAPADYVLSLHTQTLRADPLLVSVMGGEKRIRMVPLGKLMETGVTPLLCATLPKFYRKPAPGVFTEDITVRDIIRFRGEPVLNEEKLWSPSLASLASHIIKVVDANGQLQVNIDGQDHSMARRVDLVEISLESVEPAQGAQSDNLYDMRIDFIYSGLVARNLHKLYPLVTTT